MMFSGLMMAAALMIDAELPAGNIVYERTEGDQVYVHQDLRDTRGDWFYWAMRVTGAAGRTLTFNFTKSSAVGVRGPVVTKDRGKTYCYAAESGATRNRFTYTFGPDEDETWFYECLPYTPDDWSAFLTRNETQRGKAFETGVLCRSRKGRNVPKAVFGRLEGEAKVKVVLTSRHHCSESVATYVVEGLANAFLGEDELGGWLRGNVRLEVFPFVDYDGVVDGDQGKNRHPHDHNRDYTEFIYPETKAIADRARVLDPEVWIDVHCPWLFGDVNELLYSPGKSVTLPYAKPANERRFSELLEALQCGSMRYKAAFDLPFGKGWNTGANFAEGLSSINWALHNLKSLQLGRTFEVPFANAGGAVVTPETARALGRDIAKALKAFFTEDCPSLRLPQSVSGVYPTLHTFNREGECGTGAVVPWAGSLWAVSYAPHAPGGSTDKLYEIRPDLTRVIRKESIGGTPANRMIHAESNQLFIGPYVIDARGGVRTIPPLGPDGTTNLYGRLTATARHLTDPAHKVYQLTMEEGVYEVDVDTLAVREIFKDGNLQGYGGHDGELLPGYHGKGGYTGQGRLVYANNGELSSEAMKDPTVESGVLAEWNGRPGRENWKVVLRNQFTDITSRGGISGAADPAKDPLWAVGWDSRSVLLMVLDGGRWHRYRLPKGSHSYDGAHGWNTEWPRIREIGEGDGYLMTMHGTFFRFPATMSATNSAGIRARSNYLKVVGDFCRWGGKVVLGCDDTAANEFLNKRRAKGSIGAPSQSTSSLWFVWPAELDGFGPAIGRGAVWQTQDVEAGEVSDPYLFDGYDRRQLVITADVDGEVDAEVDRRGDGVWEKAFTASVRAGYAVVLDLRTDRPTAWIRLRAKTGLKNVTAFFNYANTDARKARTCVKTATKAILRSGKGDEELPLEVAQDGTYYLLRPQSDGSLVLARSDDAKGLADLEKWMAIRADENLGDSYDEASAVVTDDQGRRWRFPYADETQRGVYVREGRLCRECCTERDLLSVAGVLYELPAENAGGFPKVRAVSTPGVAPYDYATWRGLFVVAGVDPRLEVGRRIVSEDGRVVLWAGVADDLWKLGKARGVGGPWKNTAVKAGEVSDPYLMTGFDRKTVTVELSDPEATVKLEIDVTGTGVWAQNTSITGSKTVDLGDLRAYWVRAVADRDCTASVQFEYR